jgi:AcrR family transcriptional regulator
LVAQAQRARILHAIVEVVAERGFAGTTVKRVTACAGVSTRTFYELFSGMEDCFTAMLDVELERAENLIREAFSLEARWQDGVRRALAVLLVSFESQPLLARVLFVEAAAAGTWALVRRERDTIRLLKMVVGHWVPSEREQPDPMALAGVMAAVVGLIHSHVLSAERGPLLELLGPLMGLVSAPFLDRQGREREIERGAQLARAIQAGALEWVPARVAAGRTGPNGEGVRLHAIFTNRGARCAWRCVCFLAEHPESSNREIAAGVGIAHDSQISNLLARLAGEGLVCKRSEGAGKRNAWWLSPRGEELVRGPGE